MSLKEKVGLRNDYIHSCNHELVITHYDMHIITEIGCYDCGLDLMEAFDELKKGRPVSNNQEHIPT